MLNQGTTGTLSISRREYNKLYYQKRKQELLAKKKSRSNVFQLFSRKSSVEPGNPSRSAQAMKVLEGAILVTLAGLMTAYLVSEGARFYLDAGEKPWMAYLKAGAVETIAILFSFSRGKGTLIRWSQRLVVVLLAKFPPTGATQFP